MDTKYDADTKIADSSRKFEMHQAGYEVEVNTKVSTKLSLRERYLS